MKHQQRGMLAAYTKTTLKVVTVLFLAGVCIMWGWNTLAVDLGGLEPIKFRQALAFELGIVALFVMQGFFVRLAITFLQSPSGQRDA